MYQRILVANRGEIALRIIRACKELGVETVAIYSEGDRGARYLELADEAFCVGFGEPFDLAQPEAEDTTRGRSVVRPSRRALRALLRMREVINATNNYLLILRRLRSSRLEGRTARDAAV